VIAEPADVAEAAPAVTSITPAAGLEAGGTSVTITGTGMSKATAVRFGSAEAAGFTIDSSTRITAVAPPGTAGKADVTVSNVGGSSEVVPEDRFTWVAPGRAPTITKLSAKNGPAGGGTTAHVVGTGFVGVTAVHFGNVSASQFTAVSPNELVVTTPPEKTGPVEVSVVTPNGVSGITSKGKFTFGAPTVTEVVPSSGSRVGGQSATVRGTGFAVGAGTIFEFGKAIALSVSCSSTTECTMTVPAVPKPGVADVRAKVGSKLSKKSTTRVFEYT
jgi:hypothetical protein